MGIRRITQVAVAGGIVLLAATVPMAASAPNIAGTYKLVKREIGGERTRRSAGDAGSVSPAVL